jgi:hypothetical protein
MVLLVLLGTGAILVGGIAALAGPRRPASPAEPASVLSIQEDGLLYTYHIPTNTEALFDLGTDPKCRRNLVLSHPREAANFRRMLERKLGVKDLRDLLNPADPTIRTLRDYGYL